MGACGTCAWTDGHRHRPTRHTGAHHVRHRPIRQKHAHNISYMVTAGSKVAQGGWACRSEVRARGARITERWGAGESGKASSVRGSKNLRTRRQVDADSWHRLFDTQASPVAGGSRIAPERA